MRQFMFLCAMLIFSVSAFAQNTYKVGDTEYYYNKTYTTTGKPMVKRSQTNVKRFLNQRGLSSIPKGYQVDHIIPLSQGGSDSPRNMQLLTIEQHKRKTAQERSNTSYFKSFTPSYRYKTHKVYTPSYSGRTIHTGPRGGKYYINKNGNKTYVK